MTAVNSRQKSWALSPPEWRAPPLSWTLHIMCGRVHFPQARGAGQLKVFTTVTKELDESVTLRNSHGPRFSLL